MASSRVVPFQPLLCKLKWVDIPEMHRNGDVFIHQHLVLTPVFYLELDSARFLMRRRGIATAVIKKPARGKQQ